MFKPLHAWTMTQLCYLPVICAMLVAAVVVAAWEFVLYHEYPDA